MQKEQLRLFVGKAEDSHSEKASAALSTVSALILRPEPSSDFGAKLAPEAQFCDSFVDIVPTRIISGT